MKAETKSKFSDYVKSKDKVPNPPEGEVAGEPSEDNDAESETYDLAERFAGMLDLHPDKAEHIAGWINDLKDHFAGKTPEVDEEE